MLQVALAQALRRRARGLAVVLAIVMASVSFALLTSAVATSRLEIQGTVDENYRTSYDILVRPAGSSSPLERSEGLVQQNYLSGIFGGITMEQLRTIRHLPEVEVAAPVAMIGYILPAVQVPVVINDLLTTDEDQLYRFTRTWTTDRGLDHGPGQDHLQVLHPSAAELEDSQRHAAAADDQTRHGTVGASL